MASNSFTSSSVNIFKQSSIFGKKMFYQIKVMVMIKNYDQSVEINHIIQIGLIFLLIPIVIAKLNKRYY